MAYRATLLLSILLLPFGWGAATVAPAPQEQQASQQDPVCIAWDQGWVVFRYSREKGTWSSWTSPKCDLPELTAFPAVSPNGAAVVDPAAKYSGWFFDLRKASWTRIPESPIAGPDRYWDRIVVAFAGDNLVVWGMSKGPPHGAVLDTKKMKWSPIAPTAVALRYRCPHAVIGKNLLVWGGYPGFLQDGAVYDLERDSWAKMPPAPIRFRSGMAWAVWGNRFVVCGGHEGAIYDLGAQKWEKIEPPPFDVGDHSACAVSGDRLFIWSGLNKTVSNGAICDLRKGKWRPVPDSPLAPRALAFAHATKQDVLVWGGWGRGADDRMLPGFRDGARFDFDRERWEKIPDLPRSVPQALHPGW